ncbi:putative protocadherin beta-18 [Octopus vulgaris]|uniref:Protocadherin beta-18 n=1 Tax=Octopus vulgaris TaxID=6645 RepID=A0AA36BE60_OCTVU|nr:putative protocadherin beta-18 [Octopus vulgaris]
MEKIFTNITWFKHKEAQILGTYVGDIALDINSRGIFVSRDLSLISFSRLQKSKGSRLFNVTKTGKLYTNQILDAESLCKYNSECFRMVDVAIQKEESFVKIIEVKVIIKDINDNRPEFQENQINIKFSEDYSKGVTRTIPNAIDKDMGSENSEITYKLKKNRDEPFSLSYSRKEDGTTQLGIVLEKKLDREVKDTYNVQVIARDEGYPPKEGVLNVEISVTDENDNSPIFTQSVYNVSISENHQKSQAVIIASAKDLDSGKNGKVVYRFHSKTAKLAMDYFELNKETGEIFLNRQFPFDKQQTYKLFITASDNGNPPLSSTAVVLVNKIGHQNTAPAIEVNFVSESMKNTATISEGVKVGSFIAYVKVTDNDVGQNGEVTCDLRHNKLLLKSLGRMKYKVVVKKSVDREKESFIDFTISCQDKGVPPQKTERKFSIEVMDVNDVQPKFTKSQFKFLTYENEEPNFPVGFINVTDPDMGLGGQLTYILLSDNENILPFVISNFGFISTTQSLDREEKETYKFKVFVKDNGKPSLNNTENVIVEVMDENDNAPYFTFPSVNPFNLDVHYHPQSKSEITVLKASDRDRHVNAFLSYEIIGGNEKQLFSVKPYTGVLSYSRPVYQNDAGLYSLTFIVKDSGSPMRSATTTLSLMLTVSNQTSKMLATAPKHSDDTIHINLMIVIIVAAIILSVAIVISLAICIIQKYTQRNILYSDVVGNTNCPGERKQSEYTCEPNHPQYDVPASMVLDPGLNKESKTTLLKRDSQYGCKTDWKGSTSRMPLSVTQGLTQQGSLQGVIEISKEEQHMLRPMDHFNEMSTMSSLSDSGQGWSEASTTHYEILPGTKSCQTELVPKTIKKSTPLTLNRPKNLSSTTSGNLQKTANVNQNTTCNDVIDLKSTRVTSASPSLLPQPWNLPMRNSFTSYAKPLPAVPKVPYQ